jgi:hypothetical protein
MENSKMQNEIDKTLESLTGLRKAEANTFLYEKVMMCLEGKEAKVVRLVPRQVWQAAAGLALLVLLNIFVWSRTSQTNNTQTKETAGKNPLVQEYFGYMNNQLKF